MGIVINIILKTQMHLLKMRKIGNINTKKVFDKWAFR